MAILALTRHRWPARLPNSRQAVYILASIEAILGGTLLLPGLIGDVTTVLTALLLMSFLPALILLARNKTGCGCFGSVNSHPVGGADIARDAVLLAATVLALAARPTTIVHEPLIGPSALAGFAITILTLLL